MFKSIIIIETIKCDVETCAKYNNNDFLITIKSDFLSFTKDFNLICDKFYLYEISQTIVFFSTAIITLILTVLTDKLGRKKIVIYSTILNIFGFMFIYFKFNYVFSLIGICLISTYLNTVYVILFNHFNELSVKPLRSFSNVSFFIFFILGGIAGTYTTYVIKSYIYLYLIIFMFYNMFFILYFINVPESPYFLLKMKKINKLLSALLYIKNINNSKFNVNLFIEKISESNHKIVKLILK